MKNAISTLLSPHPREDRHRNGARGFTIIEVAMAASVLAFGIASSVVALQAGFRTLDVARGITLASQVAQSEIERIRLMSWADVNDPAKMPASATVDLTTMFTTDANLAARFTVTRTVAGVADRPGEMKAITITVAWKGYDGSPHTRVFQTNYCKNGIYDYYYTIARS